MSSLHLIGAKEQNFLSDNFPGSICLSLLLTVLLGTFFRSKFTRKFSTNSPFPRVKWTIAPLSFLDGYITLIKLKNEGLEGMSRIFKQYGKVFTAPVAHTEVTVISDPDIIQKLLKSTDVSHLDKIRFFYDIIFSDGLKDGLVPADADIWTPHRKVISKAFTYKSFASYVSIMNKTANQLSEAACSVADETISGKNIMELINNCAVATIAEIVMGSEVLSTATNDEMAKLLESFKRAKDICSERMVKPALLFRPCWILHPAKWELDRTITRCKDFCVKLANSYRAKENFEINQTSDNTIVGVTEWEDSECQALTNANTKQFGCAMEEMIKANFSDKEIADEVGMLMAAGHDTIVTALNFLLFHLATNPSCQRNCHVEVDEFFQSRTDKFKVSFGLADYSELEYLERCIKESLRLVPTIPIYGRKLNSPLKLSDGLHIDSNTNVIISPWLVHRDPELYPNPETFDPDRFLLENVKQRHSHSYIPFSLGVRNCVGWKIALMEMKIIMTWILKDFEISSSDKPEDVQLLFGLTVKPKREYDLKLKRRLIS